MINIKWTGSIQKSGYNLLLRHVELKIWGASIIITIAKVALGTGRTY